MLNRLIIIRMASLGKEYNANVSVVVYLLT